MTHASASPRSVQPLAVTMGEPAGIGPELTARLWRERHTHGLPPFLYVGSKEAILASDPDLPIAEIASPADAVGAFEQGLPVMNIPLAGPLKLGELNSENGACVIKSIDKATDLARKAQVSAVVTAPIHKAALYGAGFTAPGHTEYLARLCGSPDDNAVMMLAAQDLRVVPVTIHMAFKDVPKALTADRIIHAGMATHHDLRKRFGIAEPRIAVAGLNPHAGEDGTIGMEEATHIMPAVWALRDQGLEVSDPLPADTLFHAEARTRYDAVLCMYHDQALIPVKTVDFWGGVNITLGLPIIRTSPDHGTALSLAGTGTARIDSMLAAIRMAVNMASAEQADD